MHSDGSATSGDGDVTVVPPLVADPIFVDAVDEAIIGEPFADSPEAQPERPVAPVDFASLYIRHRSALALHARRFLSDAHDVEDVVQETYLRLFLAIPEIETELQALAFARRVLTNLCIDRYRAAKRRPSVINLDVGTAGDWLPDDTDTTDPVVRAEDAAIVRQALALLSPLHRAALVKREIEEKPLSVIATELGVSDESVKHLLYRARRALRRLLVGTAVDPAAELTVPEALKLANQRLGHALTSSGQYVIVFLFILTAGIFAGRLQLGHHGGADGTIPLIGGSSESPAASQPTAPGGAAAGSHHHAASRHAGSHHAAGAPSGSAAASSGEHQTGTPHHTTGGHWHGWPQPPTTPPGNGGSPPPVQPKLVLTGDLQPVAGEQPSIVFPQAKTSPSQTEMSGQFVAATDQGAFLMSQTFTSPAAGPSTLAMSVQLPVAGLAVQTTPLTTSSGSTTLSDGNTLAVGSLDVVPTAPSPASGAAPTGSAGSTHVAVALVVNLKAAQVVEETVTVTNPPATPPTAPPAGASGPSTAGSRTDAAAVTPAADARVAARRT